MSYSSYTGGGNSWQESRHTEQGHSSGDWGAHRPRGRGGAWRPPPPSHRQRPPSDYSYSSPTMNRPVQRRKPEEARGYNAVARQPEEETGEVRLISPLLVKADSRQRVEAFLTQERQWSPGGTSASQADSLAGFNTRRVKDSPVGLSSYKGSKLLRAVLCFRVDGHQVTAAGESSKAKMATTLCYMHAEELINHYTAYGNAQMGQAPPAPLPLRERPIGVEETAPKAKEFDSWDDYVDATEKYMEEVAGTAQVEAYVTGQLPDTEHPVALRAANMVRSQRAKPHGNSILADLNNRMRGGGGEIQVVHVSSRVFIATLVLHEQSGLKATGVGKNSKECRHKCAEHAICILDLLESDSAEEQPTVLQTANFNDAAVQSAPLGSLVQFLRPRLSRIFQFCEVLLPNMDFKDGSSIQRQFGLAAEGGGSLANGGHHSPTSTATPRISCTLTMRGVTCEGTGVNRFEAERVALEAVIEELEIRDEAVQCVAHFADAHPSLNAAAIPVVGMPSATLQSLQQRIAPLAALYEAQMAQSAGKGRTDEEGEPRGITGRGNEAALLRIAQQALSNDPVYGDKLYAKLHHLRENPRYKQQFFPRRSTLAIERVHETILQAIAAHRVTVVCGTTGCGKTTQVPQYIFDNEIMNGRGGQCNIIVTQPRRLSSFSVAERIADERLSSVGEDIGYAVRLDSKPGRHINICTTGVLLQMFSTHRNLEHVSHLIIDEVHERDINCDVILALVKELLSRNKHIRVILMSATMSSSLFASYFGSNTPVIQIEGATYPVSVKYLEHVCEEAAQQHFYSPMFDVVQQGSNSYQHHRGPGRWNHSPSGRMKTDYQLIAYLVHRSVVVDMRGDVAGKSILVFLPGWKELIAARNAIMNYNGPGRQGSGLRFHTILLHSTVDSAKQRECFRPAPPGTVKVVLATNIAESGITIDDAAVVIDTGLIKTTAWSDRGTSRNTTSVFSSPASQREPQRTSFSTQLALSFASQANGTQRKGRAGRTQGGVCYRLYSSALWETLPAFPEADIHRVPLTQVLLKLLSLGYTTPRDMLQSFIEPPSMDNVEASMALLQNIGAVDGQEQLTELGDYLTLLPCDPRIGKMILMGAVLHCLDSVLTVAACADVSPFVTAREAQQECKIKRFMFSRGTQSDHLTLLNAYNAFCANHERHEFAQFNLLHAGNLRVISKYKRQYEEILRRAGLLTDGVCGYGSPTGMGQDDFDLYDGENDGEEARYYGNSTAIHSNTQANQPRYTGELFVDTSTFSLNSLDVALVKACVCAALYPNFAVLPPPTAAALRGSREKQAREKKKIKLQTRNRVEIKAERSSVCRTFGGPKSTLPHTRQSLLRSLDPNKSLADADEAGPAKFYVYQDIFGVQEANQEFLTTVSAVSLWSLFLFGASESNISYTEPLSLCVLDQWVALRMDSALYHALTQLRRLLMHFSWLKFRNPHHAENNAALQQVIALCSTVLQSSVTSTLSSAATSGSEVGAEVDTRNMVDTGSITDPFTFSRGTKREEAQFTEEDVRRFLEADGSDTEEI